ncbi:MAG TPA: 2-amino-4-hydroxy-6-hydroxymethyldihydropteridine diphosphokinase [Myxococcales bacterium]|nr:2-amino-4-hydroxy-6-hydroxymethyldihydropteridine diphosphokinase [Myxococcales bacterium]
MSSDLAVDLFSVNQRFANASRERSPIHMPKRPVYIGIGSNKNDPPAMVRRALDELKNSVAFQNFRVSQLIWTDPVGPIEQDAFLNGVVAASTDWEPECILALLHAIESSMGRNRAVEQRWGPRAIDLDLLMLGDVVMSNSSIQIPHPEMEKRRFVLAPLAELAPHAVHPVNKQSVADMLEALCD